ncbi:MAG: sigma-70 family RNA polymerase sigma factor [Kofleriaceae bacterium]|nr:sigma-70 family RNA polymerase sigma factor [Kofleriaceae bacterium]MCL4224425.1 sigma-70 family RNA polymerase sigma factor [Myxococcales bacterium]
MDDEAELRAACEARSFDQATTLALERYGPEILGLLAARLRSDGDAAEVFSIFAEDLWRGLPGFAWRCSLRAWAHRVARNAANRYAVAGARRAARNQPLGGELVEAVADRVKSTTLVYLKSEVKSEIRRLRDELSPEDQLILVLRVDKGLEWRDVAMALADEDLDEAALVREAARVRKRLQLATARLRELAAERGLLAR